MNAPASRYLIGTDVLAGAFVDVADAEEQVVEHAVAEVVAATAGRALRPFEDAALPSELPNVSDAAWTAFALTMKVADVKAVSDSGSLGMFEMRPRRLGDLGLMKNVKPGNTRITKHMRWTGEWVAPLSEKKFLASAELQYRAFARSMQNYLTGILDGSIDSSNVELSLSGMLAVLHRCGPNGLSVWANEENRFPETAELVAAVDGIF